MTDKGRAVLTTKSLNTLLPYPVKNLNPLNPINPISIIQLTFVDKKTVVGDMLLSLNENMTLLNYKLLPYTNHLYSRLLCLVFIFHWVSTRYSMRCWKMSAFRLIFDWH